MEEVKEGMMPLEDAHVLLLYLLEQLNRIQEETGIPYFAHAGTLIGVLRHQGFIPWDDDVDVLIKRSDCKAFVEACEKLLPENVVLQTRESDPYFCEEYMKLCFRDNTCQFSELAVDIFILDETDPDRKLFRWFQNKIVRMLRPVKVYKVSRVCSYVPKYTPKNPWKRIAVTVGSILPLKLIDFLQQWAMTADKHVTEFYVDWGSISGYKRATRPKRFFEAWKKMPFENTEVTVSHTEIEMVNFVYKKRPYMQIPPPEKRKSHHVHKIDNPDVDVNKIKELLKR